MTTCTKWRCGPTLLRVQGDELFYAYMVDNQAIVIPETIDAIRALGRNSQSRERVDGENQHCARDRQRIDVAGARE